MRPDEIDIDTLRSTVLGPNGERLVGRSPAFVAFLSRIISAIAAPDHTVLIVGERGSEQELAARAIHQLGLRSTSPFASTNFEAIPVALIEVSLFGSDRPSAAGRYLRGALEKAQDGTMFFDAIGGLPLVVQAPLLQAIVDRSFRRLNGTTERRFDARLISGSTEDVFEAVRHGHFLPELYGRLAQLVIVVPPLRDRKDDIPLIAQHALTTRVQRRPQLCLSSGATEFLQTYEFRDGVQGLVDLIEAAGVTVEGNVIDAAHLRGLARTPC